MYKPNVILGLAVFALAACTNEDSAMEYRVSAENGAGIYATNCAACHGADAKGYNGPASDWTRPPPNLTILSAQNGGVFPEFAALSTIHGSVEPAAIARDMPVFGERDLGPTVIVERQPGIGTPIPADLLALSYYLQSIQVDL